MNKRTTDVVAYLTWVGLIIALVAGDRYESRFHLNQSLVIWLAGTVLGMVAWVPLLGWLIAWRRKCPCWARFTCFNRRTAGPEGFPGRLSAYPKGCPGGLDDLGSPLGFI